MEAGARWKTPAGMQWYPVSKFHDLLNPSCKMQYESVFKDGL